MKHQKLLFSAFALAWAGAFSVSAETVQNYTFGFNDPINTSSHDFRVGPNWKHVVGYTEDGYGKYYMNYSYRESDGVDGTGCLAAYEQKGNDYGTATEEVWDLIVTPEVQGTIKLKAKKMSDSAFIELWPLNDTGTDKGEKRLKRFAQSNFSNSEFKEVSFDVTDKQRIGIRAQYVYIDDFTAAEAEIVTEYSMEIVSAIPSNTTGVIVHNQNANGGIDLIYTVTVKNTCDQPLIAKKTGVTGTKNYSISIVGKDNVPFGAPTYVPFDLQPGETSQPFEVKVEVPKDEISNWWSYSSQAITMNLRENLQGLITTRANAQYKAYEPKFLFRLEGSNDNSSISSVLPYAICLQPTTRNFEIVNDGNAPLQIKSITIPAGFTTTAPLGASSVEAGEKLSLPITLAGPAYGLSSGELKIVYVSATGEDKTYTSYLSGTLAPTGAWTATFDGNQGTVSFPEGSIAEQAIQSAYDSSNKLTNYDTYLKSYTNADYKDADNKFITPRLKATAGAKLYFSVARDKEEAPYYLSVYRSADRKSWGEPIATYKAEDAAFADGQFHGYSIDLPAGDSYVAFALYGMKLNDVAAAATPIIPEHDLYLTDFRQTESVQSGKSFSPSISVIPVVGEDNAKAYKAVYYLGDEAIAETAGEVLEASANNRKTFNFSANKEVEQTSTLKGKIVFEFTDGTRFESQTRDITIVNEPAFVFNFAGTISDGAVLPSSLNRTIDFGKDNTSGRTKKFEIFNWGTAPLKITSITLPDGFTTETTTATVAKKEYLPVDITFNSETPGAYSGNLSIKYMTGEGEQEYTLPLTATLLDPSKWYATFEPSDGDAGEWPAGSVAQANVELLNYGTPTDTNFSISGSSDKSKGERMFVTPQLKATAGEKLSFEARIYNSNWTEGGVTVYIAKTREDLYKADASGNYPNRTLLADFNGEDTDAAKRLSSELATYSVTIPQAGDYYIGFEPYSRAIVSEMFGLSLIKKDHEWILESANVPTEAMQNVARAAIVNLRNIGLPEAAGSYTITTYINGKAQTTTGDQELPAIHKLSEKATALLLPFRSNNAGSFPVYFEIASGDYKVTTAPVTVNFADEIYAENVTIGAKEGMGMTPLRTSYNNSEAVLTLPSSYIDQYGLRPGDKIVSLTLRGYGTSGNSNVKLRAYCGLTDETEAKAPADETSFPTTGLTKVYDDYYLLTKGGSESKPEELVKIYFKEPIVYAAGKGIKIYLNANSTSAAIFNFENTATDGGYYRYNDKAENEIGGTWAKCVLPVVRLGIASEARTVSGTVYDKNDNPVANAAIRIVSADGDNVIYTGTTNTVGQYTVKVMQPERYYDVEATANGKEDFVTNVSVARGSVKNIDLTLTDVMTVGDDAIHTPTTEEVVAHIEKPLTGGFNAVAFPFALNSYQVKSIFGQHIVVLEFDQVMSGGAATVINFSEVESKEMEAGKPYLVYIGEESRQGSFRVKDKMGSLKTSSTQETDFLATDRPTEMGAGMFVINNDNFEPATTVKTRAAATLPAYSAYIKAVNASAVTFTTAASLDTGIDEAEIVEEGEDMIYDLNGFRVKNPEKGIYVINGKLVMVK